LDFLKRIKPKFARTSGDTFTDYLRAHCRYRGFNSVGMHPENLDYFKKKLELS
jgi:hypothetical protein